MDPNLCPFYQPDFEPIRRELLKMKLYDLIFVTERIMNKLTPIECLNYNINKFCQSYDDKHGRIEFVRKLIEDRIILGLQFPFDYHKNPQMEDMLKMPAYTMKFPHGKPAEKSDRALTDDLVVISEPLTIKNPRWEHKDSAIKEITPETASFGDTIILMADVTGYPEGASMTFDIFDISGDPPMVVDRASGKNEKGVVKGEWVVKNKTGKEMEQKIAFEAIVRSKATEKCEVKCIKKEILGGISLCVKNSISDRVMSDIECVVKGPQIECSGKTNLNGLVVWNGLPLDKYIVEIRVNDTNLKKVVFWKKDAIKVQTIRIRQDIL